MNSSALVTALVVSSWAPLATAAEPTAKPGYLQSYVEPQTGCRITRISGDPGTPIPNLDGNAKWSDEVRHHYSLDQAWNADQTLLALDHNRNGCPNLLLNGDTFTVISELPSFPYESRWHPVEPSRRIYIGGSEVGYFDVLTHEKTVVTTFDGCDRLSFASKGNVSDDGKRVAVNGRRADGRMVTFGYDLGRRFKYPDIVPEGPKPTCTISPSGNYIICNDGNDVRTCMTSRESRSLPPNEPIPRIATSATIRRGMRSLWGDRISKNMRAG